MSYKRLLGGAALAALALAGISGTVLPKVVGAVSQPVLSLTSPEEDQGLTGTQADTWIARTATSNGSTISKVMVKIGIHGTYGGACAINAKPIDTLCYLQSNSTSFGSTAYFFKCFLSHPNTASTSFECGPGAVYGSHLLARGRELRPPGRGA